MEGSNEMKVKHRSNSTFSTKLDYAGVAMSYDKEPDAMHTRAQELERELGLIHKVHRLEQRVQMCKQPFEVIFLNMEDERRFNELLSYAEIDADDFAAEVMKMLRTKLQNKLTAARKKLKK